MPPLTGFVDNPLQSRDDVSTAVLSLLHSLQRYQSPGGARIRIPVSTGAHFDEAAAQLEGFARPLWAVAGLIQGSPRDDDSLDALVAPFVQGMAHGTDPDHVEYWGAVTTTDQRMVEMEIISFALLAAPQVFYESQEPATKTNIINWLRPINDHALPTTNWLWFRVMTNLALMRCCGLPREELWPLVEKDLAVLDSFYLQNGWSSDGPWGHEGRQADYYSGSFAIQFSQLLYIKFASDLDPSRCSVFRDRARTFAADFMLYFNRDGGAIPFGRSLTYRFAFAGFWSAAAFAEVELPIPMDQPGIVKGLLLRHLRWWTAKHDIFSVDGTLNIGYTYPNMYMCEDYNSPQSVYWCMKSFVALALPASHPFWNEHESHLPVTAIPLAQAVQAPYQILCNSGSHHFLLNSGQFCPWPLKATEAKYGKFAYSSHFGFSVPTGPLLQQMAPDSTLALSIDGAASWKVPWIPLNPRWGTALLRIAEDETERLPMLLTSWKPWLMFDITVRTALIAPSSRWPDWHIRLHRLSSTAEPLTPSISAVAGGFAITGRKAIDGRPVPITSHKGLLSTLASQTTPLEAALVGPDGCCVFSKDGASGVRRLDLSHTEVSSRDGMAQQESHGSLLKPDANTNIMCQRTVIPTIRQEISLLQAVKTREQLIVVGVFATTEKSGHLLGKWADAPVVHLGEGPAPAKSAYVEVTDW